MPLTEARLLLIIAVVVCMNVKVSRQGFGRVGVVFLLACLTGWLAQLALGPEINLYTSNVSLYVAYVSVGIIFAWGIGLTSMWSLHIAFCRITRWRPNAILYVLTGVPAMMILEFIGSNILVMRLHDHHRYQPLMPVLNSMRAPAWLFGYYALIGLVFYAILTALRMNTGDWSRVRLPGIRGNAAVPPSPADALPERVLEEVE